MTSGEVPLVGGLNEEAEAAPPSPDLTGVDVFCNDLIKSSRRLSASSERQGEK